MPVKRRKAKPSPGVLPGEQYGGRGPKGKRPGSIPHSPPGEVSPVKPGPIVKDPAPTSYKSLKRAFKKPGLQPGEKEAVTRIAENRKVTRSEARKIAENRTSKGLSIKGSAGPKGLGKKEPKGRMPVIDKSPLPKDPVDNTVYPTKPVSGGGTMPKPKLPPIDVQKNSIGKKAPKPKMPKGTR